GIVTSSPAGGAQYLTVITNSFSGIASQFPAPIDVSSSAPPTLSVVVNGLQFFRVRSEEHTSELQSRFDLVCRLLLEKKNPKQERMIMTSHPQSLTSRLTLTTSISRRYRSCLSFHSQHTLSPPSLTSILTTTQTHHRT